MKKILGTIVFLGAVGLSLPAIDGYIFKKSFDNLLNELVRDPHLQLSVIDYRMGWFHSTAKLEVGMRDIPNIEKMPNIILDVDITHGPFIYNRKTKSLVIAEAFMENQIPYPMALQLFLDSKSRYLATSDTTFYFGGRIGSRGIVSPIKSNIPSIAQIKWDGIQFDYEVAPKANANMEVNSHVTFGAISIQSINADYPLQMTMQPMLIDSKGIINNEEIWLGDSHLNLPYLSFTNMENNTSELSQLNMQANTAISNSLYSLKYTMQLGKLNIPWNTPLTSIAPANVSMAINNLHPQYLMTFLRQLKDMRNDRGNFSDEKQVKPLIDLFTQKVLSPTSELLFDGSIQSPLGIMDWQSKLNHVVTIEDGKKIDCDIHATGKITEKFALIFADLYLQGEKRKQAAMPGNLGSVSSTPPMQPGMNMFDEKIASLMKDGKLSLAVAMQVMDVKAKNLSVEQFASEIKGFSMSDDTRKSIRQWYQEALNKTPEAPTSTPVAATTSAEVAVPAATTALPTDATATTSQQLIDGWVNDGYLVRDGEFLKLNLVKEKGVMTIGTKVIQ